MLKQPAADTLFVQARLGGHTRSADPSRLIVEQAARALGETERLTSMAGNAPLLYARVDGIVVAETLVLMEMEVNEPGLMLDLASPRGPEQFAEAIAAVV